MGQPIRGMTRPLPISASIIPAVIPPEVITLNADYKASIHNRFDVEVINAVSGEIRQTAYAENVICTQLWANLLYPSDFFRYIHYGSGTGTPASSDTSLFSFSAAVAPASANDVYNADNANGIFSLRRKITLTETQAVGVTITEVGVGYSSSASSLETHAMLKDANGNQISIAKTDTDIINIYATVFLHLGFDHNATSAFSMLAVSNSTSFSTSNGGLFTWLLGVSAPIGAHTLLAGFSGENTYRAKDFTMTLSFSKNVSAKTATFTAARLAIESGNISGGIKALSINTSSGSISGCQFSAFAGGNWYPNTSITGEAIGTGNGSTKDFATDFGDVTSATIYINGIAQSSGVSVDLNSPYQITNLENYFRLIDGNPLVGNIPSIVSDPASYPTGAFAIYYNPYHALGIKTINVYRQAYNLYTSDDLNNWTQIPISATGTLTIPAASRYHKYWKIVATSAENYTFGAAIPYSKSSANNIHFDTAPASGAVITADYITKTIAKDTNHVFDFALTFQLGEYTA